LEIRVWGEKEKITIEKTKRGGARGEDNGHVLESFKLISEKNM